MNTQSLEELTVYYIHREKRRIGNIHDGGYVINMLPGSYDMFISGGISNDISFEEQLLELYPGLTCYAFDGTIPSLPKDSKNIVFHQKNLGTYETDTTSNLDGYIRNYKNIFLKIDIEGHEFRLLPSLYENGHMERFKQIVIEIHSPSDIHLNPDYYPTLQDIDNDFMFKCLCRLNETHILAHFHANNGCPIAKFGDTEVPHVFELTYVRNDLADRIEKNKIPLPMDIDSKNISSNNDYYFDKPPYCESLDR